MGQDHISGRLVNVPSVSEIRKEVAELEQSKQDKLISGQNIKTIDSTSLLGAGNIDLFTNYVATHGDQNIRGEKTFLNKVSFTSTAKASALPVDSNDITNKQYVDTVASDIKNNLYKEVDLTVYPALEDFLASTGEAGITYLYPRNTLDLTKGYFYYIWEKNSWLSLDDSYISRSSTSNTVYVVNSAGKSTTIPYSSDYIAKGGQFVIRDANSEILVLSSPISDNAAVSKLYVDSVTDSIITDDVIFAGTKTFEDDICIYSALTDKEGNSVKVKDISTASSLQSGGGEASIIQKNIALTDVIWTSDDTDVATVDQDGTVTAISDGIATITARYEGETDECEVEVGSGQIRAVQSRGLRKSRGATRAVASDFEDEYVLVSNLNELEEGDYVVLVVQSNDDEYIGITGWNGNKDATVSSDMAEWCHYIFEAVDNGIKLRDPNISENKCYIKQSTNNNEFVYDIKNNGGIFTLSSDETPIIVNNGSVQRYLCENPNKTNYRFYGTSSTYRKFSLYRPKPPVPVTGVALNIDSLTLYEGDSDTLIAMIFPEDATNKNVTWVSSNEDIVTVDDGEVLAIHEGLATITVITEDGNYTATCDVTILREPSGNAIRLSSHNLKLDVDEEIQLFAYLEKTNIADSSLAIALGADNEVHGDISFVQGDHLISNADGQVVFGSYNVESNDKFIIGNGADNEHRSNIFTVTSAGKVKVGTSTTGSDSAKTLATKDYVDSKTDFANGITIGNTTLTEEQLQHLLILIEGMDVPAAPGNPAIPED